MSSSYAPLSTAEENESNNVNTFSKRFNRMYIKWKLSNLWKSFQEMNWNVRLVFLFTFFFYFTISIWGASTYSVLLFKISDNSTKILGLTSGLEGILTLIAIFPSGYFADRFKTRDKILRIASVLGMIAISCIFVAILTSNIPALFIASAFWGTFVGVSNPTMETIFADSIPTGDRSRTFAYKHLLLQVGYSFGPFITIFLFLFFGNDWSLTQLRLVASIGLSLTFLCASLLLFFNDKKRLKEEVEELQVDNKQDQNHASTESEQHEKQEETENQKITKEEYNISKKKFQFSLTEKWVPRVIATTDLVTAVGAGMTIKFFPVFLVDEYHLNPIIVNLIFGISPFITGGLSVLSQRLSLKIGRAQMIFITKSLGTILLFFISFLPPVGLLIPMFILRGSLMNCSEPLSRSILMDVVKKSTRGRWNALEGINRMAWTGSAVLGGFLIDLYSYQICFIITAIIYAIATLPLILIWPLVKLEKAKSKSTEVEMESLLQNESNQQNNQEKVDEKQ